MDTSGCDVTQIWIGEEGTNQTGEFLQSTHGSNGFTSEVPFGLVNTGATDAVGFYVLPYPLVGVEFRRVSRELEQAQLSMGRSHEVFDCFGPVDRMAVDDLISRKNIIKMNSDKYRKVLAEPNVPRPARASAGIQR